ncbi:MAG: branched-chain amino acid ABC transporter permease [Planctomycetota bacterium]
MEFSAQLLQCLITGVSTGLIISLVALGYTMVYGIVELINFAHGDVMMLGAFLALTLIGLCGGEQASPWLAITLALIVTPIFCASLNWTAERVVYRPLRSAPKLTVLVSAIGVSFICVNLGMFWGGLPMDVFHGGTMAASSHSVPDLIDGSNLLGAGASVMLSHKDVLVVSVTVPLLIALTWVVQRTNLGRSMRAVAQDPTAARLMGIDVDRVIGNTFLIGGALAGVAGVVLALYNGQIGFGMGYRSGLDAFTAAVLGGIGSLPGAVLGGLVIGLVRAVMEGLVANGGQWCNTVVFTVLILVLVFRPTGLLGSRVREKV